MRCFRQAQASRLLRAFDSAVNAACHERGRTRPSRMEPWGFEPQILPCHGSVIPFHYGPACFVASRTNLLAVERLSRSSGRRWLVFTENINEQRRLVRAAAVLYVSDIFATRSGLAATGECCDSGDPEDRQRSGFRAGGNGCRAGQIGGFVW